MTNILDLIGSGSGGGTVDAYTRSETDALLGSKLDDVVAGTNITVSGSGGTKTVNCTVDTSDLAQASDVYMKAQVDGALANKVSTGTVYTKGETDTLLDGCLADVAVGAGLTVSTVGRTRNVALSTTYAPQSTTYTKTEVDDKDALKADSATTYRKTEVDGLHADKLTEVLAGNANTVSANGSVRTVTSTVNPADYALQATTYPKT